MRPFNQAVADYIHDVLRDWPRWWLYLAVHGQLGGPPGFWARMTPNQLIQCWAAEYVRARTAEARLWLLREMREQRTTGMFRGEQFSSIYTTYYLAAVVAVRVAAAESGDEEMMAECARYLEAWLALAELVAMPANAHRAVANRLYSAGCRSGDPHGHDDRTDVARLALLGEGIPAYWRVPDDGWGPEPRQGWMETEMILGAREAGWIPRFRPAGERPPTWSNMLVERCVNGVRTSVVDLVRCVGFPVWSTAIANDGRKASVSHGRRRGAVKMGGGLAPEGPPANLPGLGAVVSRVEIGPGRAKPGPPSPPPPPTGPNPGNGDGDGLDGQIPTRGVHRPIFIEGRKGIVRIKPGLELEWLRWDREPSR